MRNVVYGVIVLAALVFMPACSDDDPMTPPPPDGPRQLMALTSREAVLNNIEYAYNSRSIYPIDALLDLNFTFFFAPGDVGGSIPQEWSREDELQATYYLFESASQPVPIGPQIKSMRVDIQFEDGVEWTAITPEDDPNETWYSAEVPYSYTIEIVPDMTFIAQLGTTAQFTVRDIGPAHDPRWRLVEWRDRRATRFNLLTFEVVPDTWGLVKALYR